MIHAYLITAYNNIQVLNRLIQCLDDKHNLLFLHCDRKAGQEFRESIRKPARARLVEAPSMNVSWGGVSQIACTLSLLRFAMDFDWDYCHYLTESDLPLKTSGEIDAYFSRNSGSEFVDFAPENYAFAHYKCDVYHLFPNLPGYRTSKLLKACNHGLAHLQRFFRVRRTAGELRHGSAYFSITRGFVQYILGQTEEILKTYRFTLGADEVWLQTLCLQSPYYGKVKYPEQRHKGNLRYIDWEHREGNSPHTFTEADWDTLLELAEHSECCFARKFSGERPELAERLVQYLNHKTAVRTAAPETL